jgi:hypothetical protein
MSQEARDRLSNALDTAPETMGNASGSAFTDYRRAAFQGLSFGFADEIEAAVRAAFDSGKTYTEVVKDVRGQIDSFRDRNPAAAYSTEIAAAVLPTIAANFIPGLGQAATAGRAKQLATAAGFGFAGPKTLRTAQVAGTSGAQGALYGFGAAEGNPAERLPSAAASGVMSAVAGPVVDKVAPAVTGAARDLIRKGVPVTPGQAVGGSGLLGTAVKKVEEGIADNVPVIGDAIRGAFDRATVGFNRAAVTEALAPLGAKIPKDLEGRALIGFGNRLLRTQYQRTLGKMKIDNVLPLASELDTITKDLSEDIAKDINGRVNRYIIQKFKNGVMTGEEIKKAQTFLRRDIERLQREGSELAARKADALIDIRNVFSAELQKTNPDLAPVLNNIDKAYGNFKIVEMAGVRTVADESFTPGDLLQAVKRSDKGKNKSNFAAGEARMQRLAQAAQDVIAQRTANSGTPQRLQAARIATGVTSGGLLTQADPFTLGGALLSPLAYSQAGVPIAREAIGLGGRAMRAAVPAASANTTEISREMLANILRN